MDEDFKEDLFAYHEELKKTMSKEYIEDTEKVASHLLDVSKPLVDLLTSMAMCNKRELAKETVLRITSSLISMVADNTDEAITLVNRVKGAMIEVEKEVHRLADEKLGRE